MQLYVRSSVGMLLLPVKKIFKEKYYQVLERRDRVHGPSPSRARCKAQFGNWGWDVPLEGRWVDSVLICSEM